MKRQDWPNRLGFDFVDESGGTRVSVWDGAGDHRLNVQEVEPDNSMCGGSGVRHFSLDRTCELGLDLRPERLSGEALLALVREHGEECV